MLKALINTVHETLIMPSWHILRKRIGQKKRPIYMFWQNKLCQFVVHHLSYHNIYKSQNRGFFKQIIFLRAALKVSSFPKGVGTYTPRYF